MRARAFHIMDPKGILDMIGVFLEERGNGKYFPPSIDLSKVFFYEEKVWSGERLPNLYI